MADTQLIQQLQDAVTFITVEFISNEIGFPVYPASLRSSIAQVLVEHPLMGWPDEEDADAWLRASFRWTDDDA